MVTLNLFLFPKDLKGFQHLKRTQEKSPSLKCIMISNAKAAAVDIGVHKVMCLSLTRPTLLVLK